MADRNYHNQHNHQPRYRSGSGETLGEMMTKQDKLDILMLLSALESWGFSTKSMFPDYLHERLGAAIDLLRGEVLNG